MLEPDEKTYKQMPPKCWIYSIEDQGEAKSTRSKLHDLSAFEVDPLDSVIGFYSVVGRKSQQEDEDSVILGGTAPRVTLQQMGGVSKKTKNIMAAAGSGSESASMIKAIVRADTSNRDGNFTDASVSSRVVQQNSEDLQRNPNTEHRNVISSVQSAQNPMV